MLFWFFRTILTALWAYYKKFTEKSAQKQTPADIINSSVTTSFIVWPDQIDFYGFHMNNAYYFTSMVCNTIFF